VAVKRWLYLQGELKYNLIMLAIILVLCSFFGILFIITIGIVLFFHFRKFTFPKDKTAKRILSAFEIVSLFLVLLNVVLLAINLLRQW
jgi:sensor histidine kinase YesM